MYKSIFMVFCCREFLAKDSAVVDSLNVLMWAFALIHSFSLVILLSIHIPMNAHERAHTHFIHSQKSKKATKMGKVWLQLANSIVNCLQIAHPKHHQNAKLC